MFFFAARIIGNSIEPYQRNGNNFIAGEVCDSSFLTAGQQKGKAKIRVYHRRRRRCNPTSEKEGFSWPNESKLGTYCGSRLLTSSLMSRHFPFTVLWEDFFFWQLLRERKMERKNNSQATSVPVDTVTCELAF